MISKAYPAKSNWASNLIPKDLERLFVQVLFLQIWSFHAICKSLKSECYRTKSRVFQTKDTIALAKFIDKSRSDGVTGSTESHISET